MRVTMRESTMAGVRRLIVAVAGLLIAAAAPAQSDFILAVSEGTSGGLDHARVIAKYGGLAEAIGRASKRKVQVVFAREFASLEDGIRTGRFDFVLARPSDYPARAMRDQGYQFVASARPDGHCLIITGKDSPLKTLAQAKGARWAIPEQVSYMSKFCAAELRDNGIIVAREKVQYVREQGAVPFYIDNKIADVGAIASYSGPAKTLEKTGHRVLHKSGAQPYFPLVAGKRVSAEQVRAIQAELTALPQSEAGQAVLKTVGIQAFDTSSGERLRKLLDWLGA
jgi:ABC-type phosphate/phosphonate transport system substrate-binding protein